MLRIRTCISLACATMLFAVPMMPSLAKSDSTKPPKKILSAQQIADKNAEVSGGLNAWMAVESITMSGKMEAAKIKQTPPSSSEAQQVFEKGKRPHPQPPKEEDFKVVELPFLLELARPHKMRLEVQFTGQTAIQVFDGVNGWKLRPFLGRREVENYTDDEMKTAKEQPDIEGPLIGYEAKGIKLERVGKGQVDGKDAFKLRLTMKDGLVRNVWIDTQSFLDVRMDESRVLNGKPRTVVTYFRKYKAVDGLQIPHQVETTIEGARGSEKINIDHVTVNKKLDASRFVKPM
jgi:hypothetical protein